MKRLSIFILSILFMFTLVACDNNDEEPITGSGEYFVLPDINGKRYGEIEKIFEDNGQKFTISEFDQESENLKIDSLCM